MDFRRVVATIVVFISFSAQAMMPDFFSEASSPNPDRGATSLAPNEIIDTFSGSLSIVHTDLVVPGDGGLDIRIQRSYSSNHIYLRPDNQPNNSNSLVRSSPYGLGWSLHFGRIRTNLLDPNFACPNTSTVKATTLNNPVMEMPNGSQRQLLCNTSPSSFSTNAPFISKDNWAFSVLRNSQGGMSGYQAIDPQGMKYTMNYLIDGGRAPLGDEEQVWYTTKIEDRNGNRIDIAYDSRSDLESPMYTTITSPDGRRVDFSYSNAHLPERAKLTSIRYGTRVVNYHFNNFTPDYTPPNNQAYKQLVRVSIPGGQTTGEWKYTYHTKSVGQPGDNNLKTMTHPGGATVTYDYDYMCILFSNCALTGQYVSLVVKSKVNAGRGITRGS
ncbi:MAG: hypothetical protein JKX81_01035 [Arenicella sp.]|nr:hypothetical protein [Arenicella sp.]